MKKFLSVVLFFSLFTAIVVINAPVAKAQTFDCNTVTEIPLAECQALVALYNSTGGTTWTNSTGWVQRTIPCSGYGVTCTGGNVTNLSLSNNQLSGTIPTELENLSNLTYLGLGGNKLSGTIPAQLGNLTNLTDLLLWKNQLSGTIPVELGNLTNLTRLWLFNNQLSGTIPPQLGNLSSLTWLLLDNNQLSGTIPIEVGNLSNLSVLDLSNNQLSGTIPTELGSLSSLTTVDLSNNQLSGTIPIEMMSLSLFSIMSTIDLSDNQLSGTIPIEVGNLSNLSVLDLSNNQLSGTIPARLGSLSSLTRLWLFNNQLSGTIPLSLTNITNLSSFRFNNTTLCRPPDSTFQSWLSRITNVQATICVALTPTITQTISFDNIVTMTIPAGAILSGTQLIYSQMTTVSHTLPTTTTFVGPVFDIGLFDSNGFGFTTTTFATPITTIIGYDDDLVPFGVMENKLENYYYNIDPAEEQWIHIPVNDNDRDIVRNRITLYLTHFTEFAVVAPISNNIYLPLVIKN